MGGMVPLLLASLTALPAATDPAVTAPSPERNQLELRIDVSADERFEACMRLIAAQRRPEARACLRALIDTTEGSTAALRARAALSVLDAPAPTVNEVAPATPEPFPAGRLELVSTAALFGVWNGAAGAVVAGQAPGVVPPYVSLAGGAAAVGLGAAFGLGTWLLSERLELSAGDSRLIASGIGWGTALGLSLAPWAFSLSGTPFPGALFDPFSKDFERGLAVTLVPTVLSGYLGLAGTFALSRFVDLEPAQVATANTGGLVGFGLGLALTPFFQLIGLGDPLWLGLAYLGSTSVGLLSGLGVAHLLKLDLLEVWLCDLGAALGFVVVGGAGLFLGPALGGGTAVSVLLGGATALATLGGLVGATAGVSWARVQRGELISRVGGIPLEVLFAPPEATLDRDGKLVPIVSLVSARF